MRLCYFDTASDDVPILEIADLLEPGQLSRINSIAGAAREWVGSEAVVEVDR